MANSRVAPSRVSSRDVLDRRNLSGATSQSCSSSQVSFIECTVPQSMGHLATIQPKCIHVTRHCLSGCIGKSSRPYVRANHPRLRKLLALTPASYKTQQLSTACLPKRCPMIKEAQRTRTTSRVTVSSRAVPESEQGCDHRTPGCVTSQDSLLSDTAT